jgi:hypothetical protein
MKKLSVDFEREMHYLPLVRKSGSVLDLRSNWHIWKESVAALIAIVVFISLASLAELL